MLPFSQLPIFVLSILASHSFLVQSNSDSFSSSYAYSIYEVLKSHGLPMGLLPKGVDNFTFDDSGKFQVFLDQACNAKFENEMRFERNVSGILGEGRIDELSGISAQDLFLWFPVKRITVDIPSSGLIYFDVGVVSKQFSLSSFDTPRDCTAVKLADQIEDVKHIVDTVSKSLKGELGYHLDQGDFARAVL